MLTSSMLAPLRTWSSATSTAASKSPDSIKRRNFALPVTFWRSPIITNPVSVRIWNGSRPLNVGTRSSKVGISRRATSLTAAAIIAVCSGVVPQQPPTRFTRPARANSSSSELVVSGASS